MRETWSEEKVAARLVTAAGSSRLMPTARELRATDSTLSNMVTRYGPKTYDGWADALGLQRRNHDSRTGWAWETWVRDQAVSRGLIAESRTTIKAPFDLSINGHAVDVKMANGTFIANGWQWTWRIAKKAHVCDFYVFVALKPESPPLVYIVPSATVPLTCTTHRRRYNAYQDNWAALATPKEP